MSDEVLPNETEPSASTKLDQKMKQWLEQLFKEYRKEGLPLTPDQAMWEIDVLLQNFIASAPADGAPPAVRFSGSASRAKLHHHAVDLYYGNKRGAPSLTNDYLKRLLGMANEGTHPARIARQLGQHDSKAEGRIRKQIHAARKRFPEGDKPGTLFATQEAVVAIPTTSPKELSGLAKTRTKHVKKARPK